MVAEGRSIHAAELAGTLYEVKSECWGKYGAIFPAAETPLEAAQCLLDSLEFSPCVCPLHGERIEVRRIISHQIGCVHLEHEPYVYHVNHGGLL